ncbi:hypothetical protein G4B88_021004 [Cannabis sativa]|uniref:Uncharacterized protein n=1 Tax=Cannabis sativa TaxID=3483 RepID=A0A7J6EWZ4_CANSA|nr:hypothetical protein G4B88_021004 [Cannabis sativa]
MATSSGDCQRRRSWVLGSAKVVRSGYGDVLLHVYQMLGSFNNQSIYVSDSLLGEHISVVVQCN